MGNKHLTACEKLRRLSHFISAGVNYRDHDRGRSRAK
jgi:hypothetical protein